MYVCVYVCVYVCMYVRVYVCMHACMHVWLMSKVGNCSETSRSWSPTTAGSLGQSFNSRRPLSDHRTMVVLLIGDQCTILGTKICLRPPTTSATIVRWLHIGLRPTKDNTRSPKTSTIVARFFATHDRLTIAYDQQRSPTITHDHPRLVVRPVDDYLRFSVVGRS